MNGWKRLLFRLWSIVSRTVAVAVPRSSTYILYHKIPVLSRGLGKIFETILGHKVGCGKVCGKCGKLKLLINCEFFKKDLTNIEICDIILYSGRGVLFLLDV